MVEAHRSGRADHRWVLFCLLELSEWHDAFVAGMRLLYVHSRKASFVAIDREALADRVRDRGPATSPAAGPTR